MREGGNALGREIVNFRDFGGLPTSGGGVIAEGALFRSGHLAHLTEEGVARLDRLRIGLVADLRFPRERRENPSRWPADDIPVLRMETGDDHEGPHVAVLRSGELDPAAIDRFYVDFYRTIPFDEQFRAILAATLRRMPAGAAVLVHCSVGKDRTGIFAALVQRLLGAPRDAIVADYMKTREAPGLLRMIPEIAERLRDRLQRAVPEESARKMLGVEPDYILAALDAIEARAGSVDAYLAALGIDHAKREELMERLVR